MLDPANVPDVDDGELTARFIVSKRHINRQTGTLKADAFVPHPYEEVGAMTKSRLFAAIAMRIASGA